MKIAEIPENCKPREKALAKGIDALDDAELLALILGNGIPGHNVLEISQSLLYGHGGFLGMAHCAYDDFALHPGISKAKGLLLCAVFEIMRRAQKEDKDNAPNSLCPESIFEKYREDADLREKTYLLVCSRGGAIKEYLLYSGTYSKMPFSPNDVLSVVLQLRGVRFVMVHNHPSGNPNPSPDDVVSTMSLYKKAEAVGIDMLDHVIVSRTAYYSFLQSGYLSKEKVQVLLHKQRTNL